MDKSRPDILQNLYDEEQDLLKKLHALRNLIEAFGGKSRQYSEEKSLFKPLRVPDHWSNNLPKIQKIAYALKTMGGRGTSSQIADKVHELEGSLEWIVSGKADLAYKRNIIMLVSYLHKKGRLKVEKEGGKYIFSLE